MYRVRKLINCSYAHQKGITGKKICIVIIDSGIYPHKDFILPKNRLLHFVDFSQSDHHSSLPYDDFGHGTHVTGIACGNGYLSQGRYSGIAPGSLIISIKALDKNGSCSLPNMTRAINWVCRNKNLYNIKIINLSFGSNYSYDFPESTVLLKAIEAAWSLGITVVAAAGNSGPHKGSITFPGTSKKIITVGSSDAPGSGKIYSGCGPTRECIKKPDITAPSNNIISCISGGLYTPKNGTSMSVPIVTGAIALLMQASPGITNKEIKSLLLERSTPVPSSSDTAGMLDIRRLLM